ncbi:MAG: TRAP transporter substrate-binding protein [Halanaerobiales bacterium]
MKTKISIITVILVLALLFAVVPAYATTLRLSHITDRDNIWHRASEVFAEEVEERTDGEVTVEIFPNEQLGSEMETIEGIRTNTIADLTITGESLGNWASKIEILGGMYLFEDSEHIKKVADGPIGEEIEEDMLEKANVRALTWFERGPRHLTSNEPIKTAEDAEGMQLRVPNVPWFLEGWEAIGADPSPMDFGEVYSALQQGVIDGQENPLALIHSSNFYEVQDYVNLTGHIRQYIYLVIGEDQYQSLTDDQKEAVQNAADVAHEFHQEEFVKEEKELREKLEEEGMEFVEVDVDSFRKAVEDVVYDEFPEHEEMYEKIREAAE